MTHRIPPTMDEADHMMPEPSTLDRVMTDLMDAQSQWEKENNRLGCELPWTTPHVELLARTAIFAAGGDWRSMESAPRDGSVFLAYNPLVGPYTTAFTTRWTGKPDETGYEGFPCGFWHSAPNSFPFGQWDCKPCAWRPIEPPPPELRRHPARDDEADTQPQEPK